MFSRRLACLGVRVLACDGSVSFLERARARTTEHADRIDYRLLDVTDARQLVSLGLGRFDAAVCGMALMGIAAIMSLLKGVHGLLKPGGRFVFSVLHPCFNSTGCALVVEQEEREGKLHTTQAVKVKSYLSLVPEKGVGIVGEPVKKRASRSPRLLTQPKLCPL